LQVTFAVGRLSPLHGWAPYTLGTTLPFWLEERLQWRQITPLLKRYERLRAWCAPRLLRLPGVGALVCEEIAQLEAAVVALRAGTSGSAPRRTKAGEALRTGPYAS
jgi:hypothetical protein